MKKLKGKGLRRIFAMVFTFAMVMVFAGIVGKVDAKAEEITCEMTIKVVDKWRDPISDAEPFVDIWKEISYGKYEWVKEIKDFVKNDDGSYTLKITWDNTEKNSYGDPVEGNYIASPGASAENYQTNRLTAKDAYYVGYGKPGFQLKDGNTDANESPYTVVLQPALTDAEVFALKKTEMSNELKNYKKQSDFTSENWEKIDAIIVEYDSKISDEQLSSYDNLDNAVSAIKGYLSTAKSLMGPFPTIQETMNDTYFDKISFTSKDGKTTRKLVGSNGKYSITMSMHDKGGVFSVANAHTAYGSVDWTAFTDNGPGTHKLEYIAEAGGYFLLDGKEGQNANEKFHAGTLKDCSVTYHLIGGAQVKVTFDLIIVDNPININFTVSPSEFSEVTLKRDEDLNYTNVLKLGKDYSVTLEDGIDSDTVTVETKSLNDIAEVDGENNITPIKAGTGRFKVVVTDTTNGSSYSSDEFTIEFKQSEKEQAEIKAAEEFDDMIEALGDITLDKEEAVKKARDAYDELNHNAKKYIDNVSLTILKAAEKRIAELKAEKAEQDKNEAVQNAEAEKDQEHQNAANQATAAQATADKTAAEAVDKQIEALGTITLEKEAEVTAAKDAYNDLTSGAKKLVKAENLTALKAAEQKIFDLKVDKAATEKVAAEKEAEKVALAKKYTPSAPKWSSLKSTKKNKATLKWKKNSKATGYIIYMSTKRSSGYKKIATVKGASKVTYTKSKLKSKKTYYFKVVAYRTVNGITYRSSYSAVKKVKVK